MKYTKISYDKQERVCHITLNRPQQGNKLDIQMSRELADACNAVNQDESISVVVFSGAGDNFCVGSDSPELDAGYEASQAISSIEQVTIAAIDGDALDEGLELALACDIRIATERARFSLAQIAQGTIPSAGGTQRLPRLVGQGKALELILSAETINAQEALDIGLIAKLVPPNALLKETDDCTKRIGDYAPIALRYAKEAINKGLDLTLDQGLRLEADLYFLIQTTMDRMEGIRAFMEKRPPQFKGK